jgi:hypothetical protein
MFSLEHGGKQWSLRSCHVIPHKQAFILWNSQSGHYPMASVSSLAFTRGAKDYQSDPYLKYDARLFYFDKVHPKHQGNIWKNYKEAILLREPAERLLWAYLDKVALKRHDTQPQDNTKSRRNEVFGYNVSFAEFVDCLSITNVTRLDNTYRGWTGLSWRSDPH